jgi:hypothetical protein
MQYIQAYRFVFQSPKWFMNLLFSALCILVPVVGQMVLMGWAFEVIEALLVSRGAYPDFDTNRLGKYLMRGLWPFLVYLVVSVPVSMVGGVIYMITVFAGAALAQDHPMVLWVIFPFVFVLVVALSLLTHIVLVPLCLRAGLGQDFASAFSVEFVKDFLKRMWKEMLLVWLFLVVTAPFVAIAGLLLLCVGIYFAQALIMLAQYHFWYQFYDLYLQRGGTPIPLQAKPAVEEIVPEEN